MAFQPSVAEIVETAFNVAFENPWRGRVPRQQIKHSRDCILRTPAPTETVGVGIGLCFRDRLQALQMQSLLCTVNHDGDSQWALLRCAAALGDVHPAQRLRSKTATVQPLDGAPLGFRGGPNSPSTPGVRLPSFSDTRFTASALAEYELTRNRCRAFTRRQSRSRVALAIRIC